jgi:hypothetical protein
MIKKTMIVVVALLVATVAAGAQEIWTGETLAFSKADESDPTRAENQDRITDSVWITRGNDGGQIFNIAEEQRASSGSSPALTEWAIGTTDDLENLEFAPFRQAIGGKPRAVVGLDLVLHIIPEDIYLDVTFTSWSEGKAGGFAYERSTPE